MKYDVFCLAHLRWSFVTQRPQHLISRYAKHARIFYIEEPIVNGTNAYSHTIQRVEPGMFSVVPTVSAESSEAERVQYQREIIDLLIEEFEIRNLVLWYYTPTALRFVDHLTPLLTVYDCMDELSAFKDASDELPSLEQALLRAADVVFTGGQSLYKAKAPYHRNIHALPSSVEVAHFRGGRESAPHEAPADVPRPRIGFYGVIDERLDAELLGEIARLRPHYHFVIVGPIVKIDPRSLPQAPNVHYLPQQAYADLPRLLSGWDVAMMPFAHNESTRFISPTKTLEFLAAGKRIVSTRITDVAETFEKTGLVSIADNAEAFVAALDTCLAEGASNTWLAEVDEMLAGTSWDMTWKIMYGEINRVLAQRESAPIGADSSISLMARI